MGIDHKCGNAEFVEIDATFKSSIELEYLLNVVCFDYNSLLCKFLMVPISCPMCVWAVVARVRMSKLDAVAYEALSSTMWKSIIQDLV